MNVVDGKTYYLDISMIILVCIIIMIILSNMIRPHLTKIFLIL